MTPLDRIAHFEHDLVVQAGAGTGKTHALVTLYLHLVGGLTAARRRVPPARIAVVTFTEKAAGELRERLHARLGALAADPTHEPTLTAAARVFELPLPDGAVWREALAQLGAAPVGTFHAFAGGLLRRHAARAGVDPDFTLLDESEATASATEAAERAILDGLAGAPEVAELVAEYNYRGVGRGRGLVEYLVALRAALAEEGRAADGLARAYEPQLLDEERARAGDAFRAAVAQLSEVADELVGLSAARAREMAAQAPLLHLDESAPLAQSVLDGLGRLRGKAGGPLPDAKDSIREAHLRLVEAQAALRAAPLARALEALVARTEQGYRATKRRTGALDFADLLVRARDLLRDDAAARRATQERFDALLVDEFQDTNPVQAELVDLVSGPPRAAARRFVVGDRKQSIYEFRGADVAVFARAASALVAAGGAEEVLRQSRRSAPSVLRLCNALFARAMAPGAAGSPAWDNAFEPARDDLEPTRDEPSGDAGAELILVERGDAAVSRAREARAIACRMVALRQAGRAYGQMALLLRRFTALATYLDALRAAQVPYYVVRGRGFYAAQEVRDLAAALTLVDNPDDTLALVAVLRSPIVGLSDEALVRLSLQRRLRAGVLLGGEPAGPELAADEVEQLESFRARFRALRAIGDRLGPAACLRAIVDGADLAAVLASTHDGEQRVANLERLVERARAFEAAGGDLRAFCHWLARVVAGADSDAAQAQVVDERDDVVRVMTVHQAKGLEFPVVFVPACGDQERVDTGAVLYDPEIGVGLRVLDEQSLGERVHSTPSRRVQQLRDARRHAESLRLFYVAATRARDLVIFSGERGRATTDTWRTQLDAVADDLFTRTLLRAVDGDALTLPPPAAAPAASPAASDEAARRQLERIVDRPEPSPRAVTAAVTQLADFQLCPRRHQYRHALGLLEHPAAARASIDADGEEPSLDPLRRGTLAHRLLERCDFARGGADLDELLAADGYSAAEPAVAEVRAHVARFLATDFARGLAGAALRRELPFLVAVPGERALYVRGQIDLVAFDAGGVTVLDYKHARASDADAYRFQLDAYALAARRLYPAAPSVRTGLVFLKEADPTPRIVEATGAEPFATELGALGGALSVARARDEWPGRSVDHCRRIQCGYITRCHPDAQ